MGAVNLAPSSDDYEDRARAGAHPDPVGTSRRGVTVVVGTNGRRLSTVAAYSHHVRPRRSANSIGPVTSHVSHCGISCTSAASSCRRSSALSPAVARSRLSYCSTAVAVKITDRASPIRSPRECVDRKSTRLGYTALSRSSIRRGGAPCIVRRSSSVAGAMAATWHPGSFVVVRGSPSYQLTSEIGRRRTPVKGRASHF